MPIYTFRAEVTRKVHDIVEVQVIADDADEAQDVAYEVVTNYPDTDLDVSRYLVRSRHWEPADTANIAFVDVDRTEDYS